MKEISHGSTQMDADKNTVLVIRVYPRPSVAY